MRIAAALAAVTVLVGGCAQAPGDGPLTIELDEFTVTVSASSVPAGPATLRVGNVGEIPHTFFALRTELAEEALPVVDGEVDVEADGILEVAAAIGEQIDPAPDRSIELDAELEAGHYVLICNVPGHYQSGMHASLDVTD